jgi:2-methylfumaryl-CoA isomerase
VTRGSISPILSGFRLVELSAFVAAPLTGATLAALGAEVIRVDPPGGGIDAHRWPLHNGSSLYWAGLNQGKRSITVDTRAAEGQELVTSLIVEADAVVTNLPVRGWNSYESLRSRRHDLIMAVLTGNPDGSPAVDYTVNAAAGFPLVTGSEGHDGPVNHVLPAWDALAGYLLATGLVAAELHRTRTGVGQLITLSLADVALSITGHLGLIGEAQLNVEPRPRIGNNLYGSYSQSFRTADGRDLIAVALTPRQWASLVQATDLQAEMRALESKHGVDLREEGARYELRVPISERLRGWIEPRTLATVGEVFDQHGVLWGPYRTFKDLVAADPRCSPDNPMFAEVDQPGIGRYLRAASPLVFSESDRLAPQPSPQMGADGREILRSWLRLGEAEVDRLVESGVVGAP